MKFFRMRKSFILISILSFIMCGLQACVSAAVSGANVAYDHYRIQNTIEDRLTSVRIESDIYGIPSLYDNSNLTIATFNHNVLLAGQAKTEEIRQRIQTVAAKAPHVKRVYNFITVDPSASFTTTVHDTWLTTKIKSQILVNKDIDAGNIKVVSEDGSVYLMGLVTDKQAKAAETVARKTNGVKRVVSMFEYIHTSTVPQGSKTA